MRRLLSLYHSTLGKKAIVAVTGAMLLLFLIFHVAGNLKVFLPDSAAGVPDIDVYAHFLRTAGEPLLPHTGALWTIRCILLAALLLHIVCVVQLALRSRRARPIGYREVRHVQATRPARWMLYTGALLLIFLVFHLLQFTTGTIDASRFVSGAVYANLYRAFQEWTYVALYLAAMLVLGLHLFHGGWSLFQSLGLDNPDRNRGLRRLALAVAVGLALAFAIVPAAFLSGSLRTPPPTPPTAAQLAGSP